MSGKGLLDQLFESGQDMLNSQRTGDQRPGGQSSGGLMDSLGGLLNQKAGGGGVLDNLAGMFKDKEGKSQLGSFLAGAGGGAVAGSALSLLLGNKHSRELVGNVLTYGGMAAVGAIAFKAYSNWQAQKGGGMPPVESQSLDRLAPAQAEERGQALLLAMVTAAKADGHIDQRERDLLTQSIASSGVTPPSSGGLPASSTNPWTRAPWRAPPPVRKWRRSCTSPACWSSTRNTSWNVPTWTNWPGN